jgi:transposase
MDRTLINKARAARIAAGLSAREAAELVQVATVTWQVWEGQTRRTTEIPFATLEYFRLVTGTHEDASLLFKKQNRK